MLSERDPRREAQAQEAGKQTLRDIETSGEFMIDMTLIQSPAYWREIRMGIGDYLREGPNLEEEMVVKAAGRLLSAVEGGERITEDTVKAFRDMVHENLENPGMSRAA